MAEIKITQLVSKQQLDKVINLKVEAQNSSSPEFAAYTNLRGSGPNCGYASALQ
jgi:hypothetical protein